MSDATSPLGSKANPSQYDCLPDLGDDEPYFVIRGGDGGEGGEADRQGGQNGV